MVPLLTASELPSIPRTVAPWASSGAAATVADGAAANAIAPNRPWVWPSMPALK